MTFQKLYSKLQKSYSCDSMKDFEKCYRIILLTNSYKTFTAKQKNALYALAEKMPVSYYNELKLF